MSKVVHRSVKQLRRFAGNARKHNQAQIEQIAKSVKRFGWTNPILVDESGQILAGHGRLGAAELLGLDKVPTIVLNGLTEDERRAYVLADNKIALNAGWNEELLASELRWLQDADFELELTGFSDKELNALLGTESEDWDEGGGGDDDGDGQEGGAVPEPPFEGQPASVLNGRAGWWIARKKWWLDKGLQSEIGRDVKCMASTKTFKGKDNAEVGKDGAVRKGVSVFDPVLSECVYRWFSPPDGTVLDPFAGGSVRGVVASYLGRDYLGIELRPEQVQANLEQAQLLCGQDYQPPQWIEGDSMDVATLCHDVQADLVFSCPPYADLEVYSDDPRDLSTMDYGNFLLAYSEIVAQVCERLKLNRFACFVVGDVRDPGKVYRGFVSDTIRAFEAAGLRLYSSAVLVTMVGNTSLTISRNFAPARRLGKTHQNVLVFVKGDAAEAERACFKD